VVRIGIRALEMSTGKPPVFGKRLYRCFGCVALKEGAFGFRSGIEMKIEVKILPDGECADKSKD
jgi:hypothetical protein